jgi:hypothetical protein
VNAQDWIQLAGVALNLIGLLSGWLSLRSHQKQLATGQDEIHVMVNSKLDAALARGVQLTGTLKDAGVDVPKAPAP